MYIHTQYTQGSHASYHTYCSKNETDCEHNDITQHNEMIILNKQYSISVYSENKIDHILLVTTNYCMEDKIRKFQIN